MLINDVTSDRQYVLMHIGAPLPPEFAREMPLSHSICQHTVGMGVPLSIENAAAHPLLRDCLAIPDLNIGAYLGLPFGAGFPTLTMSAVSHYPRLWTSQDRACISRAISEIKEGHAAEIAELSRQIRRR
ncbi:hypothetical protein Q4543_13365 [Salipiger sp. 1_MG-2023]|uniref:hypothetical protein n=1 Tax=Salipiger sp. 1_MG-2023 TaxID=3062665 RepID=UPI0026E19274|nr:hypothetical protein [Salipiger sp. 1_MG-2023]MDO6586503.1 hypothetical protein [Salipiger sp. 1_MG-2023]